MLLRVLWRRECPFIDVAEVDTTSLSPIRIRSRGMFGNLSHCCIFSIRPNFRCFVSDEGAHRIRSLPRKQYDRSLVVRRTASLWGLLLFVYLMTYGATNDMWYGTKQPVRKTPDTHWKKAQIGHVTQTFPILTGLPRGGISSCGRADRTGQTDFRAFPYSRGCLDERIITD